MEKRSEASETVVLEPIEVTLESVHGDTDRMIRKFIRRIKSDGILREVFLKRSYKKPSVARRDKKARARFRVKLDGR